MRTLTLVVHISLDGYVAGAAGELNNFPSGDENLAFVNKLTEHADAALMGRITYEMLNSYWPHAAQLKSNDVNQVAYSSWYSRAQKIVVSKTLVAAAANTFIIKENLSQQISEIKKLPGKNILLFGSPSVAQQLLQYKLIDDYWIFVNPVLFGKGIPLFKESDHITQFKLVGSQSFLNGEMALHYINAV